MVHMIWNPLDPLGSFAQALQDSVAAIVQLFQQFIGIPLSLDNVPFVQYLYGNALGVYQYLAMAVVGLTMVAAILFIKGRIMFVQAIVIALITAVIGPLWFAGFDQVQKLGDQLTIAMNLKQAVQTTDGVSVITLAFPSLQIDNVLMSSLTFGPLLYFMWVLFSIFVSYAFWAVAVKFLGLILLSLLGLGDKARKVFSMILAIGIVTVVIGKPFAVLFISIGQGLSSISNVFGTGFIQGLILTGSIIAAILIQPVLVFLMYKGVSPIVGKVAALVTGRVKTLRENRSEQAATAMSKANVASMQGRTQAIPYNSSPSFGRRLVKTGVEEGVAIGAASLAAKAGLAKGAAAAAGVASNVHPAAKAAFVAGSVALKAIPKRTPSSPPKG